MATKEPLCPSSINSKRPTYSCIRCADRKVRCDRQRPCGACVKHDVDCVFNASQPTRRRNKRVRVQILSDQLKRYEALLKEQGIDPNRQPEPSVVPSQKATACLTESQLEVSTPMSSMSIHPNHDSKPFKFVENSLWNRVVTESQDIDDDFETSSDSGEPATSDDNCTFIFGIDNVKTLHPSPERMLKLWNTFIENVDPLTKVIHVPTIQPALHRAMNDKQSISRSFETLLFAIYAASIMSMKDHECERLLSATRDSLLSQYTKATEAALARAKFMGTTKLVVLQALVLHIISVREIYDPRVIWSLTGVAVRISQAIGLERDGLSLGLPLFESEMRRRIWWQLRLNDFRTAELCGLAKFRDLDLGSDSTKWPTNVNDDQLHPAMTTLTPQSKVLTDIAFVALRCELTSFAVTCVKVFRREERPSNQWNLDTPISDSTDIETAVKELEETLETKYLRYCDPSQPLHLVTMVVARYSLNVVRFLTHHPRRWTSLEQTPLPERQFVWDVSMKLLEQHDLVQSNPLLSRFAWHAPYFKQWYAFIHVLDTLLADPVKADAEKAWELIGRTYYNTPGMISDMKKPVHVAIGSLCLKAYSVREIVLQNNDGSSTPTPPFILQLRGRFERQRIVRIARLMKGTRSESLVNQGDEYFRDIGLGPDTTSAQNVRETTPIQRDASMNQPRTSHADATSMTYPSFLFDDTEVTEVGRSADHETPVSMQDSDMAGIGGDYFTWEQWDTLFADSNAM